MLKLNIVLCDLKQNLVRFIIKLLNVLKNTLIEIYWKNNLIKCSVMYKTAKKNKEN